MVRYYFAELGLNVVKNRVVNAKEQYDLRVRLNRFIEKNQREHCNCSMAEGLDFDGLVK